MNKTGPIDARGIRTYSLQERQSKVSCKDFAKPVLAGSTFSGFLESLPHILAANDLLEIAGRVAGSFREGKEIIVAMGAHVIKVGLNPVLIMLMEEGLISGLALNGAGVIHDTEVALVGRTSEDVAAVLGTGEFGMAEETAAFINEAIDRGNLEGLGLGEAIGREMLSQGLPYNKESLLATAARLSLPVTVHVAIGTDIVHMHPDTDGAAIGKMSLHDFRLFCTLISRLEGGVYFNIGSAVVLPEVFLKALSLVRNLGYQVSSFTTVNMDFLRQYRPMTNVVCRPTQEGGKGYALVGHHEIMVPLLAAAIIEELKIRHE